MDGLSMIKQVHTHNKSLPAIVLSAFEIAEERGNPMNSVISGMN